MDALSRRLPDVLWQHAIAYGALDDVRHAALACKDLKAAAYACAFWETFSAATLSGCPACAAARDGGDVGPLCASPHCARWRRVCAADPGRWRAAWRSLAATGRLARLRSVDLRDARVDAVRPGGAVERVLYRADLSDAGAGAPRAAAAVRAVASFAACPRLASLRVVVLEAPEATEAELLRALARVARATPAGVDDAKLKVVPRGDGDGASAERAALLDAVAESWAPSLRRLELNVDGGDAVAAALGRLLRACARLEDLTLHATSAAAARRAAAALADGALPPSLAALRLPVADADARVPLALAAGVARLRVVPLCGGDRRPRDYMPWTARDALERAVACDVAAAHPHCDAACCDA